MGLTDDDIGLLKRHDVKVSHNPESNMKLASGIAPVPQLLAAGVCVGLGTDGAASNNNLDLFLEMDTAAKLHKVATLDPTVLDAETVLRMATIEGARALGLAERIGSIEPGKKADLILIDTRKPHLTPMYHAASQLVYAARGSDVATVIVDGRLLMEDGRLLTFDVKQAMDDVVGIAAEITPARSSQLKGQTERIPMTFSFQSEFLTTQPMAFNTLIHNATILTCSPAFDIIPRGWIGIAGGRIEALGPEPGHAGLPAAGQMIDAHGGIVMPGLVNTHTHLPMTLLRGLADDLPLTVWLNEHIFPSERAVDDPGIGALGHSACLRRDGPRGDHHLRRRLLLRGCGRGGRNRFRPAVGSGPGRHRFSGPRGFPAPSSP